MLNPKNEITAKPVKIRIMSGDEEHSTLESLLRNFDIKDVIKVMDGRLSRWLENQGYSDAANKIKFFEKKQELSDKDLLPIIKALFNHKDIQRCTTPADVADIWLQNSQYKKSALALCQMLAPNVDTKILLKWFKNKDEISINWEQLLKSRLGEHNPELWFDFGLLTNESMYIDKAAKSGFYAAKKYLENKGNIVRKGLIRKILHTKKDKYHYDFRDYLIGKETTDYFEYEIKDFRELNLSVKEKKVLDFFIDIQSIWRIFNNNHNWMPIIDKHLRPKWDNMHDFLEDSRFCFLCVLRYLEKRRSSGYSFQNAVQGQTVNSYNDLKFFEITWNYEEVRRMNSFILTSKFDTNVSRINLYEEIFDNYFIIISDSIEK